MSFSNLNRSQSETTHLSGDFYLQLFTITHKISPNFAFYTVSTMYSILSGLKLNYLRNGPAYNPKRRIGNRKNPSKFARRKGGGLECPDIHGLWVRCFGLCSVWGHKYRRSNSFCRLIWILLRRRSVLPFLDSMQDSKPNIQCFHYSLPPWLPSLQAWMS